MLSNGQIEAAMPVLLEWRDRAPTDAEVCTYLAIVESGELEPVPSASDDAQWASMPISDEMQRQLRIDRGDSASAPSPSVAPIVSQTVANRNDHSSA